MSKQSTGRHPFVEHSLREVREGHILNLAGSRFAVLAKERRRRLVLLDLEAEDGGHASLIGVPAARVRLRERMEKPQRHQSRGTDTVPVAGLPDRNARPGTAEGGVDDDGRSNPNVQP